MEEPKFRLPSLDYIISTDKYKLKDYGLEKFFSDPAIHMDFAKLRLEMEKAWVNLVPDENVRAMVKELKKKYKGSPYLVPALEMVSDSADYAI